MGKNKKSEYYGEDQLNFVVSLVKEGLSATKATQIMCDKYGLPHKSTVERNYRKKLNILKLTTPIVEECDEYKKAKERVFNSKKKYYLISWAQQESTINEDFLTNIEAYANHLDADIHIICGRYKNPMSLESSKQQEKKDKDKNYWHPRLQNYLDANRQKLHEHLSLLADVKVQPTAETPLSGLNSITGLESCIIGHPRLSLKSLPVMDGYPNKLLVTTGAITLPNYTDTKAGVKGEFHHVLGFVIVEVDGDIFHIRQVQCSEDGSFYDLKNFVRDGAVSESNGDYPAIIFGDIHYGHHNEYALQESLFMARHFGCNQVVLHDIFDGKSISHHELNNPFAQLENERTGAWDLEEELNKIVTFINDNQDLEFIVVRSNHDDFLDRWLINSDWRKQPNRLAYLKYATILASGFAPKGVLPYVLTRECSNVACLGINDSYRIGEWELGTHGHLGNNGSRGSIMQFKNLNTKTVSGHSHTTSRENGALVVGTLSNLRLGYNNSYSSWMNSNVIIYPNGKASHINIVKGKWTTLINKK